MICMAAPCISDDVGASMERLCEKQKTCALSQMDKSQLTPEMQQMMAPMLDSMCTALKQQYSQYTPQQQHKEVFQAAAQCFDSMSKLSCKQLMKNPPKTKSCKHLESLGNKYKSK